jgi:hypothetical protein
VPSLGRRLSTTHTDAAFLNVTIKSSVETYGPLPLFDLPVYFLRPLVWPHSLANFVGQFLRDVVHA